MKRIKKVTSKSLNPEWLIFFVFLLFSWWLMWKTFRINSKGNLEIAAKVWSDFAANIPLIRSFSLGANFPPQFPLFAGPPIRYHFGFFLLVGLLEKIGLPLDWALNLLSSLSFFALLLIIYLLAKNLFNRISVGIIAAVLFLFNGSLAFLEFFKTHPINTTVLSEIIKNTEYSSFGPYDGKIVSAFWSLNIYTNQRHLAFAYAAFLFLVLIIYKASESPKKLSITKALLVGIAVGLFPFMHMAVFGMMGIALIIFFLIYKKIRLKIFIIGIVAATFALPQILYMGIPQAKIPFFNPGYLVESLSIKNFLIYWFLNLGLASLLVPLGFLLAKKKQRKVFLPFIVLFIVGNLFQFSPEIAANHKFFNLFIMGGNMFIAFALTFLWKKKYFGKLAAVTLFFFLTLSGIIDFFPLKNDGFIKIEDHPNDPTVTYIIENTPKDSVFLNATFLYNPASLAGRKIYLGWPYFPWSAGHDTNKRLNIVKEIYKSSNINELCKIARRENINYLETHPSPDRPELTINYPFFEKNFFVSYKDEETNFTIYNVDKTCSSARKETSNKFYPTPQEFQLPTSEGRNK